MIADGLNATDVLEYVATNMVDSIYLAVFDDVESPDIGAVLYRETLEAKADTEDGDKEVVSNVPDVSNDAYVVRYIRRTWPWTYDHSIEMSE